MVEGRELLRAALGAALSLYRRRQIPLHELAASRRQYVVLYQNMSVLGAGFLFGYSYASFFG